MCVRLRQVLVRQNFKGFMLLLLLLLLLFKYKVGCLLVCVVLAILVVTAYIVLCLFDSHKLI